MAEGDDKKLTVPKFSSFKTKAPTPTPSTGGEESRSGTSHREEREHRRSEHRHHSHRHHRDSHHRERSHREKSHRDERRDERRQDDQKERSTRHREDLRRVPESPPPTSVPGLFVIDSKGDPLVRKYGLDKYKIPAYYRRRGGRILGASGRVRFDWDGPVEKFTILLPGQSAGFNDRRGLQSKGWQKRETVRIRARRGDDSEESESGFLSFESRKKRKRHAADSDSSEADDQPSWRSIEGKAKANKLIDSEEEESDSSSENDYIPDRDNPLKWKSMQLNRQVKDHPEDIDAWMELVDHQNALLRDGETVDQRATENAARSFTEIKVHLLESALPHASRPEDRQRVLVALMREGVKVWTRPVADKKWARIADEEEQVFALWKLHLDYAMSNVATVQFEDIKRMLLDRLQRTVSRSNLTSQEDLEEATYIFLRATRFFHDAGYKELAVASWQGLLELNVARPDGLNDREELLAAFQDFWENEAPRIGEMGAQGWNHYYKNDEPAHESQPPAVDDSIKPPYRNPYAAWEAVESLRERQAAMPARTMDSGTDDDPFRVIMYSDIEPLLFVIPPEPYAYALPQLINAFLLFCGLPPAFRCSEMLEKACHDQFIRSPAADLSLKQSEVVIVNDQETLSKKMPAFSSGNCCAKLSPELLFGGGKWFSLLYTANLTNDHGSVLADSAIQQLVFSNRVPGLALYHLGLCYARQPGSIKKAAKALLTRFPDDVELYNAYALAEFSNGKTEVGQRVVVAAMGSPALLAPSTGFVLFKTWCWMEMQLGRVQTALQRLCASVAEDLRASTLQEDFVSPATILKARQQFMTNAEESLHQGQYEAASSSLECFVLLEYLACEGSSEPRSATQGNISAAMDALKKLCLETALRSHKNRLAMELVLQGASRLLYNHAIRGPFRRVYLREQLAWFIERFPRNTIFLNLFAWADARIRVLDDTRQILYEKVLIKDQDSVSSRVFAIQHELDGGHNESARAAFESALRSDACKSNVMLWASYIRFCHSQKHLRTKAKDVFFRALAHCPWSKEVMMQAFVTLAGDLEAEELRSVYRTMTSKGLRVHVDLDEYLETRRRG